MVPLACSTMRYLMCFTPTLRDLLWHWCIGPLLSKLEPLNFMLPFANLVNMTAICLVLIIIRFMMDSFMGRDYDWVKNYLMDYAQQRATGGYCIVHDSTSDFRDVLCTSIAGRAEPVEMDNDVGDQQMAANAGDVIQPMTRQENMPEASATGLHSS